MGCFFAGFLDEMVKTNAVKHIFFLLCLAPGTFFVWPASSLNTRPINTDILKIGFQELLVILFFFSQDKICPIWSTLFIMILPASLLSELAEICKLLVR